MIWRSHGVRALADVQALSVGQKHRSPKTIRARCIPVACDVTTRVQLYDVDESVATLSTIKRRACTTRRKRTMQPA